MSRTIAHRTLAEAVVSLGRGLDRCAHPEDRRTVGLYLAALAPVLADAVLGVDVLPKLREIERLLGHTWLTDESPFADGLAKWRQFTSEYEREALGAMTVNERLHAMGMLEAYDRARGADDWDAVATLLRRVYLDEASISKAVKP